MTETSNALEKNVGPASSPTPKIYKYMQREHAGNLLNNGVLLLSPLRYYTNQENLSTEVGDRSEGIASYVYEEPDDDSTPRNPRFIKPTPGVKTSGNVFAGQYVSRPAFIWCVTMELSSTMIEHFGPVAVEVVDEESFNLAVIGALQKRGLHPSFDIHGPVSYGSKVISFGPSPLDPGPAFYKKQRYSYQKEYRFLWEMRQSLTRVFVRLDKPDTLFRIVPASEI